MKALFIYIAALAIPFVATASGAKTGDGGYVADISSSEIVWKGYKVTGQHHGTVELLSGKLNFQDNLLTGGEFTIDMTTIKNIDMVGGSGAAKLEGHLKSDDFFGVETYPTATLQITKVIPYGTAGNYRVAGDLTIKGITKPVKFMTQVTENNGVLEASADITIDRSEYNVRYGSGSFFDNLGDKAIHDEFELQVKIALNPA